MKNLLGWCLILVFFTQCKKNTTDNNEPPVIKPPADTVTLADCERCIVFTNNTVHAFLIIDVGHKNTIVYKWNASQDRTGINKADVKWFGGISEAKPVYNNKYILTTNVDGGVALVRLSDGKAVFYTYVGGLAHSAELLPDGNMVVASSDGNILTVIHVDTLHYPDGIYKKKIYVPYGHNVVWDKKRKVLWSAGKNELYKYQYNFNCLRPDLTVKDSFPLPGNNAHDLFPVYGKDSLWFTNPAGVYSIDMKTKQVSLVNTPYQKNVKSVSSGPQGWPTIIMQADDGVSSTKVLDIKGNVIFRRNESSTLYKARWLLPNLFSYPVDDTMKICN